MPDRVYLDYNATAPIRPEAAEAMAAALDSLGNPSSVHGHGRAARRLVEDARERVAALVGAAPSQIVFTSGGTEANNLAIQGAARVRSIVSAVEHDSVLVPATGAAIAPVEASGVIDLDGLEALLRAAGGPALVCVMLANNETGVVQPLADVVAIAHAFGALVHCDAVQAAGKLPVDFTGLGVDLMALSAHKLGGPPGVGALVVTDQVELTPLVVGGGQERGRRAGTENVPGIAGFAAAAQAALAGLTDFVLTSRLRDDLEARALVEVPEAKIFGAGAERLANTSCLAMPSVASETQVMALDLAGIAVSAGSACSSGKVGPSHVLRAMGVVEADRAIRVSLGRESRPSDIDRFVEAWSALAVRRAPAAA